MTRKGVGIALGMALWTTSVCPQIVPELPLPSDSEIRTLLQQRVDELRQATGMVVGIVSPAGHRVIAYGSMSRRDKRPVDGDTIFEIGSLTKIFTSLLLAEMVERGEVALSDPVAKYLPNGVKVPERGGHNITLLDLATHTSGLPRVPSNMHPKDPTNPYADYSAEQLWQFLSTYTLARDIGSQYEYSNLGAGLLAFALARRVGMHFEDLVQLQICGPLGMTSTRITLSREMKARLAVGHDALLAPMPSWDFGVLEGAGAIKSSANDLLTLLAVNLGFTQSHLDRAAASMLKHRRATGLPGMEIALAWHVVTRGGNQFFAHDGGTFGYRAFAGFNPGSRIGVVVLSNAFTLRGGNDIGSHLLDPTQPLGEERSGRTAFFHVMVGTGLGTRSVTSRHVRRVEHNRRDASRAGETHRERTPARFSS